MIQENIQRINATLKPNVRLVAVSKFNPNEAILEAYNVGQRLFGESKAQELVPKAQTLPQDIKWHFIGHLQTNKVKQIVPYVSCIESVDSLKLLKEINKQAVSINRTVDCLLQFHIAQEETKFGLSLPECEEMLSSAEFGQLQNIRIVGVMGMASISDNQDSVRREFASLREIFAYLKLMYFKDNAAFKEISMGMTHDYIIAMEEGATLVRVGSGIFGERIY